ncbi:MULTISPECIES: helix-turn-helix transcriptional regulator [Tepidanaerobacter]|uniref:helix-turn-helix domain-containing protein n=1 Tax=Tepidanaerobacter TaxID=499228 RepID=UPI001BD42885|nr:MULTISPECIES: helix-turn-helix transcriptional regulator [Tepidanaerobacter]
MDIGARLKELRTSRNITITALANKVGLTREHLSNIERNVNMPSLQTLQKICDALDITLAEFFSDEDSAMPPEITRLLQEVKDLTPEQIEKLTDFIKAMK